MFSIAEGTHEISSLGIRTRRGSNIADAQPSFADRGTEFPDARFGRVHHGQAYPAAATVGNGHGLAVAWLRYANFADCDFADGAFTKGECVPSKRRPRADDAGVASLDSCPGAEKDETENRIQEYSEG